MVEAGGIHSVSSYTGSKMRGRCALDFTPGARERDKPNGHPSRHAVRTCLWPPSLTPPLINGFNVSNKHRCTPTLLVGLSVTTAIDSGQGRLLSVRSRP